MSATSTQPPLSEQDERLMAGFSHLFGGLVALIIWATQRERSDLVRFQALQAIAFDVVLGVAIAGLIVMMMGCQFCSLGTLPLVGLGVGGMDTMTDPANADTADTAAAVGGVLATLLVMLTVTAAFLPPCLMVPATLVMLGGHITAAVQAFSGKDFRYPWLGKWLEKRLAQ